MKSCLWFINKCKIILKLILHVTNFWWIYAYHESTTKVAPSHYLLFLLPYLKFEFFSYGKDFNQALKRYLDFSKLVFYCLEHIQEVNIFQGFCWTNAVYYYSPKCWIMSSINYYLYSTIRKFLNVVLIIYSPIHLWLLWPYFLSSTFVWPNFLGNFFLCWLFVVWFPNFFVTHVGFGLNCCCYGCLWNTWP